MKKIEAIIKPHKLESVQSALSDIGIDGLTAYEVNGYGRQGGNKAFYLGSELTQIEFIPKIKIEVVVDDDRAEEVRSAIADAAHSGSIGDGKIFTLGCAGATRIRTGESGPDAL